MALQGRKRWVLCVEFPFTVYYHWLCWTVTTYAIVKHIYKDEYLQRGVWQLDTEKYLVINTNQQTLRPPLLLTSCLALPTNAILGIHPWTAAYTQLGQHVPAARVTAQRIPCVKLLKGRDFYRNANLMLWSQSLINGHNIILIFSCNAYTLHVICMHFIFVMFSNISCL